MIPFKNLKRGDTAALLIPLAADYSAAPSALWTLKRSTADADSAAVTQKANGYGVAFTATSATVTLVHADTKPLDPAQLYHWDLQVQVGGVVTTVEQGTLRVDADVTREVVQTIPIYQTDPVNPATLAAEVVLRTSADASVAAVAAADLSTEEIVRLSGDASIALNLSAEVTRSVSVDAALSSAITTESSRAGAAESSLAASIATKATTGAAASFASVTTAGAVTSLGHITSGDGTGTRYLTIDGGAGSARMFRFRSGGVNRAALYVDSVAEDGANAGSNLQLDLYSDAGAWLRAWLRVVRATGASTINGDTTISGALTISGLLTANGGISTSTVTTTGGMTCRDLLAIAPSSGNATVYVASATASDEANIRFREGNVTRWTISKSAAANLTISANDSAGGFIGNALWFHNASRAANFDASVWVGGTLTATGLLTANGGAKIGSSGATIASVLTAVATLDFPSIAAQSQQTLTVTVTGAVVGASVALGLPASPASGVVVQAYVSAANAVAIRATNITGGAVDPASASYRVTVFNL